MTRLRVLISTVVVGAAWCVLAVAGPAGATGAGAVSVTQTIHNATETSTDVNPCTGAPGTLTLTYNAIFHITSLANGTYWATFTQTGTFSFVPFDSSQPSYTGHFTVWDGENWNKRNTTGTATFTVHGTGSDGSRLAFHETAHFSSSATGLVVAFDKPRCG